MSLAGSLMEFISDSDMKKLSFEPASVMGVVLRLCSSRGSCRTSGPNDSCTYGFGQDRHGAFGITNVFTCT